MLDKTDSLTVDLPFRNFENHLQLGFHRQGHQTMSWPNSPVGSPIVDPRLTLYGAEAEDLYLVGNLELNSEPEPFWQQQFYEAGNTVLTTSDIWIPDSSMFTALKSVVPKSIADEGFPNSSMRSTTTLTFASPLYRQVLFSVANNFAGLDGSLTKDLIRLLTKNTYGNLYHMVRFAQSYSSRAIIQRLFEVAIEAGNANIVDVLIREHPRDIKINEQFCSVEGKKYTPIERATYLRHEDLVICLMEHKADLNRTHPENLVDYSGGGGALGHAVGYVNYDHDEKQTRVETHPKIFRCILDAGGDLSARGMQALIYRGEVELIFLLMSVNTRRNVAKWNDWGIFCRIIEAEDEHTSLEAVKIMLEYGADINRDVGLNNEMRSSSHTVIDAAAQRGYLRVVKLLLDAGASTNGDTLLIALKNRDQDLVSLLLARGADVNSYGSLGITPLERAIRCEVRQVLKLIEDHGTSARMQEQGYLADMFRAASASVNIPLITQLIRHGCKVRLGDLKHALITAIKEGRNKAATILIDAGAAVDTGSGNSGKVPLCEALRGRNENLVMALLDADANPNPNHRSTQDSPILLAAEWGNQLVIKSLIFAGATINEIADGSEGSKDSAFNIAVKRQDYELVRFLLASGADINFPGPAYPVGICGITRTALSVAARRGDFEMARFLLDQGADPNDSAALLWATWKDKKIVDLLFEKHSARYPMDTKSFGAETLAKAINDGNESIVKLMLERKVNASKMVNLKRQTASPFGFAISRQQQVFTGCLELFLQNGCHPNDVVSETRVYVGQEFVRLRTTGFLAAVGTRNTSMVELFIRYGADVNFPTRGPVKRTPIQKAAELASLDIIELLFNHGADINASPARRGGGTALQLAAISGYMPIACWLLSHGADPNGLSSKVNGRTALEGAAEHGRLDMVQLLLNAGAGSRQSDDIQVAKAIELARTNGHYPICDLLTDYFSLNRWGSGMEMLPAGIDGNIPDLSLDEDFSDLVDFDF